MVFSLPEQMDAFLRMQLIDLAQTLARMPNLMLDMENASFFERADEGRIGISQLWTGLSEEEEWAGQTSDVYLRAAGSARHSDAEAIKNYLERTQQSTLPRMAKQLLAICEENRLEQVVVKERPGTASVFTQREQLLLRFISSKAEQAVRQKDPCGLLICCVYFHLRGIVEFPWKSALGEQLNKDSDDLGLSRLKELFAATIRKVKHAKSTQEVSTACLSLMKELEAMNFVDTNFRLFDIRAAGADNNSMLEQAAEDGMNETNLVHEQEVITSAGETKEAEETDQTDQDQDFPGWPRETKEKASTGLSDQREREAEGGVGTEEGRPSLFAHEQMTIGHGEAQAKGVERSSADNQVRRVRKANSGKPSSLSARINAKAEAIWLDPSPIQDNERADYVQYARNMYTMKRKLTTSILKMLHHKQSGEREQLMAGRLGSKLIRIVTEEQPRLFYKKKDPSREVDASFLLLVDCSASMYDKMEETKAGIVLFHEALLELRIPHQITGFWEDAPAFGGNGGYPNYFQTLIPFSQSLSPDAGPAIMQLEPQQDNRDGFAIRTMLPILRQRAEKHKFIIVFTDGEPAAADYYDGGILDTYKAVIEARRQEIDVIGVFLSSDGEIKQSDRQLMANIYGNSHITVPSAADLPEQFVPVLRRLLLKAVSG